MKSKNKRIMAVSFVIGILLFTATAFADITAKSGYDAYKSAVKNTAAVLTKQLDSFTLETMISLKDNDRVLVTQKTLAKADMKNNIEESTETVEYANGENENRYTYSDSKTRIFHSQYEDVYHVTEYGDQYNRSLAETHYRNPFEEERAKDVEKVFDALVGDIRNYAMIEENDDGSKKVSGSIDESQIPPLINALASLGVKQFVNEKSGHGSDKLTVPELTDEIYIKQISGSAFISKDNIAENNLATFIISGKDKKGGVHELTLDIVFKLYDINSTEVTKPDLTGKKVRVEKVSSHFEKYSIDKRYIGKWKNEIVDTENEEFVRKATRYITIKSIDDQCVKGSYTEKRFDEEKEDISFDFEAKFIKENQPDQVKMTKANGGTAVRMIRTNEGEFEFKDSDGNIKKARLHFNHTEVFLAPIGGGLEHGQFFRVFD